MNRETTFERLASIFREVFDDDEIEMDEALTADEVEAWDCLSNIRMIVAVEEDFDVRFSTAEFSRLKNVGEFVDLILQKVAA